MASISICSKILSTIASPAFTMAYEKGVSIWEARNELSKLKVTIETIQAVLNDAENKQEGSDAVKNWIQRLKGVLYDAEDFFDEVLAEDLLKQQMMEGKNKLSLKNKVRVSCSKLNPIVSKNSIAKKVKVIRGRLAEISNDMAQLGFVQGHPNDPSISMRSVEYSARCFIGEKYVIGRDEEKNVILKMLDSEPSNIDISDGPVVIAIDGIGGMGKTTLAHLIYNDNKVKDMFNDNRWFACISDTTNEKEVLGKIYQSICGGSCSELNLFQLQKEIEGSIGGKKFLLVLDDVWEDDHGRWKSRKSMLSSGAKGSKIIVTTRLQSVVKAMGAIETHNLKGLSEEDSWDLFKSLAFDSPYQNDPRRENVGRKLLQRCRVVPLAIWCMGSLLRNKTIQEWEEIERVDLPIVGGGYNDEVMRILKLSYNHLPSHLKQCFIYCSLFPKDYRYQKMKLIWQWIAQGYITIDKGESSFMHLLRMGFFQEKEEDEFGEIESCKIHDIMHDLAMHLGGEETIMMSGTSLNVSSCTRYVSLMVDGEEGGLRDIPTSLLNVKSIRSFILSGLSPNLDQVCSNYKLLRTLILSDLRIEHIPPSIGELKLLRYLDLSGNKCEELPDSIANLVNLMVLDISSCTKFKAWPNNFNKLIKLWSLSFTSCYELKLMPEGIRELACLQYLSEFKVIKESEVDPLNGLLKQLRGYLLINFSKEMEGEDELNWQLPADVSLQNLEIERYPSQRIGGWGNTNCTSKLESLKLRNCVNVKYLPPLKFLPNLKRLDIVSLYELEFMEEEELNSHSNSTCNKLFFPCLKKLRLKDLPKLKGWRGKVVAEATSTSSTTSDSSFLEFPHLSNLDIDCCPNLESFPQCPNLQKFILEGGISSTKLFSYTYPSLRELYIYDCSILEKLHLSSPHLQCIEIETCDGLMSIELVGTHEPSLRDLDITDCKQLKSLHIEQHLITGLKSMSICNCPKLRLNLSETKGKRLLVQQGLREVEGCKLLLERVDAVFVEQLISLLSPRQISIEKCNGPISLPSIALTSLREITISQCEGPISLLGVALASLQECQLEYTDGIERLHIPSPHLRYVSLQNCMGLISVEFQVATVISIENCNKLKSLRIAHPSSLERFVLTASPSAVAGEDWDSVLNLNECSSISTLILTGVDGVLIERLLSSTTYLQGMSDFKSIGSLTLAHTSLEEFIISDIPGLKVLNVQSQNLTSLCIEECSQLTNVSIVNPTALTELWLVDCPKLRLSICVDWEALTNLKNLCMAPLPSPEELPRCLLQRQALGHLQITEWQGSQGSKQ